MIKTEIASLKKYANTSTLPYPIVSLKLRLMYEILLVILWSSSYSTSMAEDLFFLQTTELSEVEQKLSVPSIKKQQVQISKRETRSSQGDEKIRRSRLNLQYQKPPSMGIRPFIQSGGTLGGDRERGRENIREIKKRRRRRAPEMPPPGPLLSNKKNQFRDQSKVTKEYRQ